MGSIKGRKMAHWSGNNAPGWLVRGVIQIYYGKGHRKDTIGECLRKHIPRDVYVPIIGGVDVTNNAIEQRGHKGAFDKNVFEHPDKHPLGMKMLPYARKIVDEKLMVTREQIDEMVAKALGKEETVSIDKVTVDETGKQGGLIYIITNGGERCSFGITTKDDASQRIQSFAKGDISGQSSLRHTVWLSNARMIETALKQHFKPQNLGNERYDAPADTVFYYLRQFANQRRVAYFLVVENGRKLSEAAE